MQLHFGRNRFMTYRYRDGVVISIVNIKSAKMQSVFLSICQVIVLLKIPIDSWS